MLKTLRDILLLKCPRCREGNLFDGAAYNPKHIINMPQQCHKCKQPFFLEPGFYYGAMYISYALNVGIGGMITFFIWWLIWEFDIDYLVKSAFITTGLLILIFPYSLRLSRSMWLYLFYKGKATFYSEHDKIDIGKGDGGY